MDQEILDKYIKAGKIGSQVKSEIFPKIKPGMKILDLAEMIEKRIIGLGGLPAFPVNIGINEITAHYTPQSSDAREIKEGDLVKIDTGIHIDGYVADMAYTYCSEKHDYIETVENALSNALSVIRPGVKVSEISDAIQDIVEKAGLGIIINLSGHGLQNYVLHGPPSIPNVRNDDDTQLQEGDVIAIEPFVTESNGMVKDSEPIEIFSFLQAKAARLPEARKILEIAANEYMGLPFAKRWIVKRGFSAFKAGYALRQLEGIDALKGYHVLKESRGKPVAQAEHTVIVSEKQIITTKP